MEFSVISIENDKGIIWNHFVELCLQSSRCMTEWMQGKKDGLKDRGIEEWLY